MCWLSLLKDSIGNFLHYYKYQKHEMKTYFGMILSEYATSQGTFESLAFCKSFLVFLTPFLCNSPDMGGPLSTCTSLISTLAECLSFGSSIERIEGDLPLGEECVLSSGLICVAISLHETTGEIESGSLPPSALSSVQCVQEINAIIYFAMKTFFFLYFGLGDCTTHFEKNNESLLVKRRMLKMSNSRNQEGCVCNVKKND